MAYLLLITVPSCPVPLCVTACLPPVIIIIIVVVSVVVVLGIVGIVVYASGMCQPAQPALVRIHV